MHFLPALLFWDIIQKLEVGVPTRLASIKKPELALPSFIQCDKFFVMKFITLSHFNVDLSVLLSELARA